MLEQAVSRANSVLLHTALPDAENRCSYLFVDPVEIISTYDAAEVPACFARLEVALASGAYAAGYLSYECGYHFVPRAAPGPRQGSDPLLWFGIYRQPLVLPHQVDQAPLRQAAPTASPIAETHLALSPEEYSQRIAAIQALISAGDTYQVNFTSRLRFACEQPVAELYQQLIARQPVSYAAVLNTAQRTILSFSPELFFRVQSGNITTRPMKGTRACNAAEEEETAATELRNHAKNRSEHVMIVDLLRNDLGQICEMGSVCVTDLFRVERYATLLQMTSTITGRLQQGLSWYRIFQALFPCGSITGAPKLRTMQIIREQETEPRGVYTGAIGYLSPTGDAVFNVAIRTLELEHASGSMGVGGGIVADSVAAEEYRECMIKAAFLTTPQPEPALIETMLWHDGIWLLDAHLERLRASCLWLQRCCDESEIRRAIHQTAAQLIAGQRYRLRLLLSPDGVPTVQATSLQDTNGILRARLAARRTHSTDLYLRHKTTRREAYDAAYRAALADGWDEAIFLNERDELTEGCITNLFVRFGDRLVTPPLHCGVLPGVLRGHLLQSNVNLEERVLTLSDLQAADAVLLGNSVRGLQQLAVLQLSPEQVLHFT
ncbi:MAG: aminodeoxychorismate synthase component I [Acidobacteriota bacterium]|nr:aminodeoxychorismate synthase component I [Acidobacteriota bacterium]